MSRAIWTGSISFGLVEIPVSLHSAVDAEEELKFTLLDRRDMKPVGYSRVNKETGREVPWGEIVRGYQHEKGEFVVLSDSELKSANVEKSQTVDIVGFVERADIDPIHFDKPYYLKPLKKGSKGYALLHAVLEKTGKAGISTVVLRTRQYLACLLPRGPALALDLLRYADEIRSPESLGIQAADLKTLGIRDTEIKLAEQLVEGMSMKWDPKKYRDEYHDDVMAMIERKIKTGRTEEVAVRERPKKARDVFDLMPLLKKSLEDKSARPAAAAARRTTSSRRARKGA